MDAKTNGAMPASPVECQWREDGSVSHGVQTGNATGLATGLTKREAFAMAAMQGILGNAYWNEHGGFTPQDIGQASIEYADALLAELAKEPE